MGDFIELGMEGVDKLVDKHFDKVPDSALHIHNYHPKNLSKKERRRRKAREQEQQQQRESSSSEEEEVVDNRRRERRRDRGDMVSSQSGSGYPIDPYAIPPQYSREPPRLRPQYIPPIGGYPPPGGPPYSAVDRRSRRDFDDNSYYSDSYRNSAPRRPKAITRRSSSYHGPRNRYSSDEDSESDRGKQMVRRKDGMSNGDKMKDVSKRYDLKGELEKNFTSSPAGITGGVLGALVGGWAARKAQESQGRKTEEHKASSAVVTALGAAVGGLVVNTVIDKWQDKREEADEKQEKWEEKWGSDDERYWGKERHYDDRDSRDRGRGGRDGRDKRDGRGYSR